MLEFTRKDLEGYTQGRTLNLSSKSQYWLNKASELLWEHTKGKVNQEVLTSFREYVIKEYASQDSWGKFFNFAIAFLKYLSKVNCDDRYKNHDIYLEKPKSLRKIKALTPRIVTTEDVISLIRAIDQSSLNEKDKVNFKGQVLFLAYTGQRPLTTAQITGKQIKEAITSNPPVLKVEAEQDKIRMEHYVPLNHVVVEALNNVLIFRKGDNGPIFDYNRLIRWLQKNPVTLSRIDGVIQLKDLRKYFEQKSDEIGFIDAYKNYIMSHGVSGINWKSYKQFLPESVYNRYSSYWNCVKI